MAAIGPETAQRRNFCGVARKRPSEEDHREALKRLLAGLARSDDLFVLTESLTDLHPNNDTFPGEVFMRLAVDALDVARVSRDAPIEYEGLRETFLPECDFRGKENRKFQYAVLTSASLRGGLEPDVLDEVIWWNDDYWYYALCATVALIRACAQHDGVTIVELVEKLADRHGVPLN